mmetsp:Transcript_14821/g.29227  ORF Transcript_14821/g.29227 Transcript_14821/m.29227 type:complete len:271 (-) Transcript_14821:26-838(-)
MLVVLPDNALHACSVENCDLATNISLDDAAFNEELDLNTLRRRAVSLRWWLCSGLLILITSGTTLCVFQRVPRSSGAKHVPAGLITADEVELQILRNHACKTDPNIVAANISKSVAAIGKKAFYDCYFLSSVNIPTSVTLIEESAFKDAGLTSVSIPNSVTSLGERAFWCCPLVSVSISESLRTIPAMAFAFGGKLQAVIIPESVTYIGHAAFYLSGLSSVCLPENVTDVGEDAFCDVSVTLAGFVKRSFEDTLRRCGCNITRVASCQLG